MIKYIRLMDQILPEMHPRALKKVKSPEDEETIPKDPVTLKRVAREAGVSVSTVSLVLSGKGRISAETRRAVLDTVERLEYRKRKSPTTGRPGSTVNIAVLINTEREWSFLWNFERLILNALESVLAPEGYGTVLIPLRSVTSWGEVLEKITSAGCRAVFPMHYGNEELFLHLERIGLPVIPIFNNRFKDRFFTVGLDDVACAADAVEFLLRLGHRRIGYLDCGMEDLPSTVNDRYTGFRQALSAAGLGPGGLEPGGAGDRDRQGIGASGGARSEHRNDRGDSPGGPGPGPRLTVDRDDFEELKRGLASLFSGPPDETPTALFVLDDDLAARTVRGLSEMGLAVPGDVSVIAAGDTLDYTLPHLPRLTTMSIDLEFTGRIAGDMMLLSLSEGLPPRMLKIGYTLIRRGSCAPPDTSAATKAPPPGGDETVQKHARGDGAGMKSYRGGGTGIGRGGRRTPSAAEDLGSAKRTKYGND
jgi:DNA-binding LacI/PurR family transcriptional regulator